MWRLLENVIRAGQTMILEKTSARATTDGIDTSCFVHLYWAEHGTKTIFLSAAHIH